MRLHVPRRGRRALAGATVVGVAAAGIVAYAAAGASANYRTAVVALGNVTQVLDVTGIVSPSGRSDLQFGTAGTVSTVLAVGTVVHKGDVVASLDTTQLGRSLVIAQASVAQALAQLSIDQTTLDTPTAAATPTRPQNGGGAAAEVALAGAQRACLPGSGGAHAAGGHTSPTAPPTSSSPSATSTPTASGSTTPISSPQPSPTSVGTSSGANTAACAAALQELSVAVHRALASGTSTSSVGSGSASSAGRTSGQGASTHVTTATISRDEATLAEARTKVIQAQQQLTGAVITAPADGTVAAVDVTVGSAASAGTTATTVIGAGLTTVTINATLAQVGKLKIDQTAEVSSTVGAKVATGKVTWIGTLPSSATTSTFPVVVTLDGAGKTLEAGLPVDVAVSLGSANGVITVPTSAVRGGSVTVLDGSKTSTTRVSVGLVGPDRTQIRNGLLPGQTVVLADLNSALPTSTVNQTRFGGGLGGGFGGTGFAGGTRRGAGG